MAPSSAPPYGIEVARTREAARAFRLKLSLEGQRMGLVPTMGALHEGHLSLIRLAAREADVVAASLFVNPTQFAAHEDFGSYPRREADDIGMLEAAGCRLVYCPQLTEIYPPGDSTRVRVGALSEDLEGAIRPHFFEGVASVVTRLFAHLGPDLAVFGEKDYQQLLVIRALTRDLGFPIRIIGGPTQRDPDGLAMSSRNAYLGATERREAGALPAALQQASERLAAGEAISDVCEDARLRLLAAGFSSVDYIEARHAETLSPMGTGSAPAGVPGRILAAARLGTTRLIDNLPFQRR
jgi:pantoate--beta-alanine ligase